MTKEKIRQKAIERAKEINQRCGKPCKECEYGEYFLANLDVTCLAINGYEHGFADGVEEGKRLSTACIPTRAWMSFMSTKISTKFWRIIHDKTGR